MEDKAKIERCKYSHPHFKNNSIEYHCVVDGWEDDNVRKLTLEFILEICRSKFLLHIKKAPDSL